MGAPGQVGDRAVKKAGVCQDCGTFGEGDFDQGDMQFYCERCWSAFEVDDDKVRDGMCDVVEACGEYACVCLYGVNAHMNR